MSLSWNKKFGCQKSSFNREWVFLSSWNLVMIFVTSSLRNSFTVCRLIYYLSALRLLQMLEIAMQITRGVCLFLIFHKSLVRSFSVAAPLATFPSLALLIIDLRSVALTWALNSVKQFPNCKADNSHGIRDDYRVTTQHVFQFADVGTICYDRQAFFPRAVSARNRAGISIKFTESIRTSQICSSVS